MADRIEWYRDEKGNLTGYEVVRDNVEPVTCPKCGCDIIIRRRAMEGAWVDQTRLCNGVESPVEISAYREHPTNVRYHCTRDECMHSFGRKWRARD